MVQLSFLKVLVLKTFNDYRKNTVHTSIKSSKFHQGYFYRDDPVKTFLGGMRALGGLGKKNLLKGLLRMVLPNPQGNPEDGKIMLLQDNQFNQKLDGVYLVSVQMILENNVRSQLLN